MAERNRISHLSAEMQPTERSSITTCFSFGRLVSPQAFNTVALEHRSGSRAGLLCRRMRRASRHDSIPSKRCLAPRRLRFTYVAGCDSSSAISKL